MFKHGPATFFSARVSHVLCFLSLISLDSGAHPLPNPHGPNPLQRHYYSNKGRQLRMSAPAPSAHIITGINGESDGGSTDNVSNAPPGGVPACITSPTGKVPDRTNFSDIAALTALRDTLLSPVQVVLYGWGGTDPCGAAFCNPTVSEGQASGLQPCDWPGVMCEDWRVTGLTMHPGRSDSNGSYVLDPAMRLNGTLPLSLLKLDHLRRLDLRSQNLTGALPELGPLSQLEVVDLSGNTFTGLLPSSWGNLTAVQSIYLSKNLLEGLVPETWLGMAALEHLNLNGNAKVCFSDIPVRDGVTVDGVGCWPEGACTVLYTAVQNGRGWTQTTTERQLAYHPQKTREKMSFDIMMGLIVAVLLTMAITATFLLMCRNRCMRQDRMTEPLDSVNTGVPQVGGDADDKIGVHYSGPPMLVVMPDGKVAIGRISGFDRPHIHSISLAKKSSVPESWEGEGSSAGTQATSDVENGLETTESGETDPARLYLSSTSAGMQAVRARLIAIRSALWLPTTPSETIEPPRDTSLPQNDLRQTGGSQQWIRTTHRHVPFDVVDITRNDLVADSSDLQHRLP